MTVDGTNGPVAQTPLIKNIEILQARAVGAAATVNASASSFTNLVNANSSVGLTFTGMSKAVDMAIANSGTNASTFIFANNALASQSGSLNLSLDSVGTKATAANLTIEVGGTDVVKTLAVDAIGVNNITVKESAASVGDTLTKLVVTGAGSLKIASEADGGDADANGTLSQVTTIDASANTGGVNIDLATGGNAKDVTFTGGAGDDRVSFAATQLTSKDVLEGGAGSNTIAIADASLTATTTNELNKGLNAAKNFQWLEFTANTTGSALAVAANGVTSLNDFAFTGGIDGDVAAGATAGVDTVVVTGLASDNANNLRFTASYIGEKGGTAAANTNGHNGGDAISLAPLTNGPSDAVTLTLSNATLTGGAGSALNGTGTVDGNGGYGVDARTFETVNIVSTGANATDTNGLVGGASGGAAGSAGAGIIVNTNGVINVSGANALTLTTQSADPTAGGVQVNASALTGKLTVTGTTGNDIIVGGSAGDVITGGVGVDTLTGNGGADTFKFAAGDSAANATVFDSITDFAKGSDILDFTANFAVVQNNINPIATQAAINAEGIASFNAADDTLAKKVIAVEAGINAGGTAAAGQFAVFEHDGNSFVFISDGTDNIGANDVLIQLTGVTGLTDTTINADGNLLIA